ncbi:DUF2809 domain-containing protein [Streptomyces sp. NPDC088725]|uniref:ribosomal maturation YjgA family protein n=1 Tax=Streptomyces sp. NPDC088725 TaxID=3365873 RepID=UPI003829BAFC
MEALARTRLAACGAAVLTVGAGLGVRAVGSGSGDVAKYGGDALYTVLVYALIVTLAPQARPFVTALGALGFSCAVELLQLTALPAELAERSRLARLILGSTFNAPDLTWYAVGALCAGLTHATAASRRRRAPARAGGPFAGT